MPLPSVPPENLRYSLVSLVCKIYLCEADRATVSHTVAKLFYLRVWVRRNRTYFRNLSAKLYQMFLLQDPTLCKAYYQGFVAYKY